MAGANRFITAAMNLRTRGFTPNQISHAMVMALASLLAEAGGNVREDAMGLAASIPFMVEMMAEKSAGSAD
jgi:hypothetical protein